MGKKLIKWPLKFCIILFNDKHRLFTITLDVTFKERNLLQQMGAAKLHY